MTKLEWKCHDSEHPSWFSSFKNVVTNKVWCKKCGINKDAENNRNPKALLLAQEYAKNKGGQCLSSEYINNHTKMEWKCKNHSHPSWFSTYQSIVSNNHWCSLCGDSSSREKQKNHNGLKEAQTYALSRNGFCLSKEYINSKTNMEWKCHDKEHSSWMGKYENVVSNKTWCAACANNKKLDGLSIAKSYATSRNGTCLSQEYINTKTKLEWKCDNKNHPSWFSAYEKAVRRKQWCPECHKEKIKKTL